IVNHGVSVDEQNELRAAGRGFFDLPTEEKKRYWEGSSFEYLSDQVDFSATWPTVCRDEVVNHSNRMKPIGRKILEILMNNLNARMEEQDLMGTLRMNVNYYPECPDTKLTVGTACMLDTVTSGSISLIPPVMGAIVVNIGDMLQILSNDRYKRVEHLVMASRFLSRISFAYYCGPSYDSVIEPLRDVLENGEKPLYKPTMYKDYMKYYFARPHTGSKTIESIKLP
ncbi:hypothetical protein HID58_042480, partial [Brassica napus]